MRIVLFGSQLLNISNYCLCLPKLRCDIFMTPLVPLRQKRFYQVNAGLLREVQKRNVCIIPIFLHTPDDSFRHFLNPLIVFRDARTIFQTLKQLTPDSLVCFYILNAIPLAIFKKLLHYDLVLVATGADINLRKSRFHKIMRKIIYSQADLVFAVSKELKEKIFLESGYEPLLLPTGTDTSFFSKLESESNLREKWNFRQDEIIILTVCNLVKHKGVNVLIEAVGLLQESLTDTKARLLIVGEGPEKSNLEDLTSNLGLDKNVVFLGYRNRNELLELYNIADLFVLASFSEGLPFALLEAMACENICISTPVGDIGKVIRGGANGFLVKTRDSEDLATKMREALSMPEKKASRIRAESRKTIEANFDLRKITEKLIDIISNEYDANATKPEK